MYKDVKHSKSHVGKENIYSSTQERLQCPNQIGSKVNALDERGPAVSNAIHSFAGVLAERAVLFLDRYCFTRM